MTQLAGLSEAQKESGERPNKEVCFHSWLQREARRSLFRDKDEKQTSRALKLLLGDSPRQLPKPPKNNQKVIEELGFLTYLLGLQGKSY